MKKSIKYLFLLVTLILGGIGLVACNKEKVLAKEEDAYMMQAVSAVNIGGNSQSVSNPNVRLDSDNSFDVEFENQIVYHYQFSGNIDIWGARISFSENSYHEKSYRNKR